MKVKNVMFTGFAAAILGGACGAANAADYTLASQGYVTKQLESKQNLLTAGEGIKIEGDEISASFETQDGQTVTMGDLVESVDTVAGQLGNLPEGTTVAEALAGKQEVLTNAEVLESITSEDVVSIGETAAAVETLSQKAITTDNMTEQLAGYATDGELTAVTDIATAAGTAAGAAQADVDALELVVTDETTGLGSKVSQATYDAHLESQKAIDDQQTADIASNKRAIDGLSGVDGEGFATLVGDVDALKSAVNNENGAVATKIAAAIATETERADAAYAPASLAQTVAGKQDEITNLNEIEAGAAAGSTALQPGANISELTNNLEYQTATNVADTIAAGKYLTSNGLAAGTYLVSTDGTTVSYKSVEVIDANGNPVQF